MLLLVVVCVLNVDTCVVALNAATCGVALNVATCGRVFVECCYLSCGC
jgi:hypothetical protein